MELDYLGEEPEKTHGIRYRCLYFANAVVFFIKDCKYDMVSLSLLDQ